MDCKRLAVFEQAIECTILKSDTWSIHTIKHSQNNKYIDEAH